MIILHLLAWPFTVYVHAWQHLMVSNAGDVFVPLVLLVALPALVFTGLCALIDSAR